MTSFVSPDELRVSFCAALSAMYRTEVPLYGELIDLVDSVNDSVSTSVNTTEGDRLRVERHGAIRLGKPSELAMIARLFRQMGMYPVGYYDLSPSGVPVHATAFRPTTPEALAINPFRVFTSLLLPEQIDAGVRQEVVSILEERDIFHPLVRELVAQAEREGGLSAGDAEKLVAHALETFRWHDTALVSKEVYERMHASHPLVADIAGFRGPHINHLTPRVLDIDCAQDGMWKRNITPKQIIEGPPKRKCDILLRQTSFQALTEPIRFPGAEVCGSHRARFGEIESRGCALTKKGHALYLQTMERVAPAQDNALHQAHLQEAFASFPDTWEELRAQDLAYFYYTLVDGSRWPSEAAASASSATLDQLVSGGIVRATPIVYEDFLPTSAAGIFQSNLDDHERGTSPGAEGSRDVFERSLGGPVRDGWELYDELQAASIRALEAELGVSVSVQ